LHGYSVKFNISSGAHVKRFSSVPDQPTDQQNAGAHPLAFAADQVLAAVIDAGALTLNIPDTVGYNTPDQYFQRLDYLIKNTRGGDKVCYSWA